MPSRDRYPLPMRLLHWTRAVLILGLIALGWLMTTLPDTLPAKFEWMYPVHKEFGVLAFLVGTVALVVRLRSTKPPHPPGLAQWETMLSGVVHYAMLALAIVVPLMGYAMSSSFTQSDGVPFFVTELPELLPKNDHAFALFALAHKTLVMPTFTLVPLLVKQHFGGGAQQVAILESLGGAGMIAGGVIVAAIVPKRLVSWILWGFTLSCATLAATALMPPDLFWLAVIFWALSGAAFILGDAPFTALIQTTVPNRVQGRVLALLGTLMGLAAPIGLLTAALLGEVIGVRWLFVLMGGLGTLVSLLAFLSSTLRNAD